MMGVINEDNSSNIKKIKLFVDSFVAFSFLPIRIISVSGLFLGLVSIVYALYIMYNKIIGN